MCISVTSQSYRTEWMIHVFHDLNSLRDDGISFMSFIILLFGHFLLWKPTLFRKLLLQLSFTNYAVRASVKEVMGTIETAVETNGLCHNSTIHLGPCGCLNYIGQQMIRGSQKIPKIEAAVVMMALLWYGMSHYANLIRCHIHVWLIWNGRTDRKCAGRMQSRDSNAEYLTLSNTC